MGSFCGVISRVTIAITYIRGLITPLITTQEPPSTMGKAGFISSTVAASRSLNPWPASLSAVRGSNWRGLGLGFRA